MGAINPNEREFLKRFVRAEDDIRRLKMRGSGGTGKQYENFITDPIVVRLYPAAYVTDGEILGVRWLIAGGTATISFLHNSAQIYLTGSVSFGGFHMFDSPIPTTDGNIIQPNVIAVAAAAPATMSFLVRS